MLLDAELFVMSDQVLVEVLGRIRPADRGIPVPAPYDTAAEAADGERVLPTRYGELPTWAYLRRYTIARARLAHYVAAHLGSTACPITEELARPLWELTEPDAARWRDLGMFADPMLLPDHVSWRDRFLLCAGHLPHPLGH